MAHPRDRPDPQQGRRLHGFDRAEGMLGASIQLGLPRALWADRPLTAVADPV